MRYHHISLGIELSMHYASDAQYNHNGYGSRLQSAYSYRKGYSTCDSNQLSLEAFQPRIWSLSFTFVI